MPAGFVLCTDDVDVWREALRAARVEGVQDVGSYLFASTMIGPGEASAIVSTDDTAARELAAETETAIYCASTRRDEIVVTPLAA